MKAALALLVALAAAPAFALSPSEVFRKVSPSVWAVRGLDAQERPFTYGSAVVIEPGRLITNCHVLARARSIQLRRENVTYEASLEFADAARDLCTLTVKNFAAPAVETVPLASVQVGQRVYAIGNPEKLALTLSEGLISGLRSEDEKLPPVQTTAPISPGSSGGGLFDDQGRLIGITTLIVVGRSRVAQNLNFAIPAEWIGEVPGRAREQLAARRAPKTATAPAETAVQELPGLPRVGTTWKYTFRDTKYSTPPRAYSVRVAAVAEREVREAIQIGSEEERSVTVDPQAILFSARRVTSDYSVIELAPYFFSGPKGAEGTSERPSNYPGNTTWNVEAVRVQNEDVAVPAGTYKAVRLDVSGSIGQAFALQYYVRSNDTIGRFHYTAWYAPEVGRIVRIRNQTWNLRNSLLSDELTELTEFKQAK